MNEAQVRHDLIDPSLKAAGWELLPAKVTVEQTIALGPVSQEDGQSHNPEFSDYVLMYGNRRIAVVAAKAREGVAVCETMRKAILKEAFE